MSTQPWPTRSTQQQHNIGKNGVIWISFLAYFKFSFVVFIEHCLTLFSFFFFFLTNNIILNCFIFFRRIILGMNKNSRHDKESRYMLYKRFLSSYTSTRYKKSWGDPFKPYKHIGINSKLNFIYLYLDVLFPLNTMLKWL